MPQINRSEGDESVEMPQSDVHHPASFSDGDGTVGRFSGDGVSLRSSGDSVSSQPFDSSYADFWPDAGDDERDEGGDSLLDLRDRVTIMLLFREVVRSEQVDRALKRQKEAERHGQSEPLWRYLLDEPNVNREGIFAEAADVYAFKKVAIPHDQAVAFINENREAFTEAQWKVMRELSLLPVSRRDNPRFGEKQWIFVTHDPTRVEAGRFLRTLGLKHYELCYAPEKFVRTLQQIAFPKRNEYLERIRKEPMAVDLGASFEESKREIDEAALEAEISRSALINLFEAALVEAVRQGASDIHIVPTPQRCIEITFRIDGRLTNWHLEDRVHPEAFLAVVKDNSSGIDRFERDRGQDGFIQRWIDGALIRFRVSVIPLAGVNHDLRLESVVIRVLDDRNVITDLDHLGFHEEAQRRFKWAIQQPYGMVILTGPTGSGKSTTLYAALSHVVSPEVNVLTVEDPVEYIIPGVRQVKLSHKYGMEDALRSILRHDPDIVMVGEIRDRSTAELAIKLSNTGHLTFSTLHTNDAASAINRLYKMGIEPFLIAYTLNLVVAQRLVRRLCPACKEVDEQPSPWMLERAGFTSETASETTFYRAGARADCETCRGTGYRGRRAIVEAMPISDEIRQIILGTHDVIDEGKVRNEAIKQGMWTLQDSARHLVTMGETSVDEMLRVVSTEY